MSTITHHTMQESAALDSGLPSTYFHMTVADVDVKVKIVAIGQPSEAVSVFCMQVGNKRQSWDSEVETRAQNLLEILRRSFASEEYKIIPLMANNYAGVKIHPACAGYHWTEQNGCMPSEESNDIFVRIRQALEDMSDHPGAIYAEPDRNSRRSFHNRVAEQALRNEIGRILNSPGHDSAKINSLMRLIDRAGLH